MSITLDGPDGLFTRLGRIVATLNTVNTYRGTELPARVTLHVADYQDSDTDSELPDTIDGIYQQLTGWQSSAAGPLGYLRTLAQQTIIDQVALDVTLADGSFATSLAELVRQMTASSDTIQRAVYGTSVATASGNTGDAVCAVSLLGPTGVQTDLLYDEAVDVRCTQDAQTTSGAGAEIYTARGTLAQSDLLHYAWPKGSGAQQTLRAQHPAVASTTVLTNGSFDTVPSANTFTGWTVDVGTAGTQIVSAGSGSAFGGQGNVLEYAGDGSNLTSVYQDLTGLLTASTVYALGVRLKVSAVPATGTLTFSLTDGSGTVQTDAAGNACTVTKLLTGATTSYVATTGFLRTPAILPSTLRLRIKLTTALENGKNAFIDQLTLAKATRLYAGGPYLAVFAGATKALVGDSFTATFSNDYSGLLLLGLWRLLNLPAQAVQFPTAALPSLSDALVE